MEMFHRKSKILEDLMRDLDEHESNKLMPKDTSEALMKSEDDRDSMGTKSRSDGDEIPYGSKSIEPDSDHGFTAESDTLSNVMESQEDDDEDLKRLMAEYER